MNEILPQDAPLPNGHAEGLGPVPVMETIPVAPKKRRKRKAKPAAPKVARTPKPRFDPIRDEASKASTTTSPVAMVAAPIEEAPTPTLLTGVGADHFVEARERRLERMFDADARTTTAPPIKSSWRERFVFGLRRMTGFDPVNPNQPSQGLSLRAGLILGALTIAAGATVGFVRVWF